MDAVLKTKKVQKESWMDEYFWPMIKDVPYLKDLLLLLKEKGIMTQSQICKSIEVKEEELQKLHEEYCIEHIVETIVLGGERHYRLTDFCMYLLVQEESNKTLSDDDFDEKNLEYIRSVIESEAKIDLGTNKVCTMVCTHSVSDIKVSETGRKICVDALLK